LQLLLQNYNNFTIKMAPKRAVEDAVAGDGVDPKKAHLDTDGKEVRGLIYCRY
jgi:hypothetical protein